MMLSEASENCKCFAINVLPYISKYILGLASVFLTKDL